MNEITLTFTTQQLQVIDEALQVMPYNKVAMLINSINNQINEQITREMTKKEEVASPVTMD